MSCLLARREAGKDLLPHGPGLHPADELLHHLEIHIGFEERQANFPQGLFYVVFLENAPAAELLEYSL